MRDDSRQTSHDARIDLFGKYANCIREPESGFWYAESDMVGSGFALRPRPGALPSPQQDSALLTAIAEGMHEEAATRMMLDHFAKDRKPRGRIARLRAAIGAFRQALRAD